MNTSSGARAPFRFCAGEAFSPVFHGYGTSIADAAEAELGRDVPREFLAAFVAGIVTTYAQRNAASSRNQLKALIEANPLDALAQLEGRLDEWEGTRPGKIARRDVDLAQRARPRRRVVRLVLRGRPRLDDVLTAQRARTRLDRAWREHTAVDQQGLDAFTPALAGLKLIDKVNVRKLVSEMLAELASRFSLHWLLVSVPIPSVPVSQAVAASFNSDTELVAGLYDAVQELTPVSHPLASSREKRTRTDSRFVAPAVLWYSKATVAFEAVTSPGVIETA